MAKNLTSKQVQLIKHVSQGVTKWKMDKIILILRRALKKHIDKFTLKDFITKFNKSASKSMRGNVKTLNELNKNIASLEKKKDRIVKKLAVDAGDIAINIPSSHEYFRKKFADYVHQKDAAAQDIIDKAEYDILAVSLPDDAVLVMDTAVTDIKKL
jgi:arsenate reductase-like glutaredoxin family protein